MATFITTAAISHNIEEIIKNAQKYFVIVSPYLSIHKLLRKKIEAKLSEADEHFKIIFVCKENYSTILKEIKLMLPKGSQSLIPTKKAKSIDDLLDDAFASIKADKPTSR